MKQVSEGVSMAIAKVRKTGDLITTDMVINNNHLKDQELICHGCNGKYTTVIYCQGLPGSYAYFRRLQWQTHKESCKYGSPLKFFLSSVSDFNISNQNLKIELKIINESTNDSGSNKSTKRCSRHSTDHIRLRLPQTKTSKIVKFIRELVFAIGNDGIKKDLSNVIIITEAGQEVLLTDLVGNQQKAIQRVKKNKNGPVPAIITGSLTKPYLDPEKKYMVSHLTTTNGLHPFRIYVGKDRAEEERECLEKLVGQQIMIYGIASKPKWGKNIFQLELYSSERQIVIM